MLHLFTCHGRIMPRLAELLLNLGLCNGSFGKHDKGVIPIHKIQQQNCYKVCSLLSRTFSEGARFAVKHTGSHEK